MTNDTEKFDSMHHDDWWGPKGRLFSLHKINPLRFGYFSSKVDTVKCKKVLDIGCGGGILAEEFAKAGAVVTGIDLSSAAVESAKKHAAASGLEIEYRVEATGEHLKEHAGAYDVVVCAEVLEHVDDIEKFLEDSLAMLAPGGTFFFGTINKTLKARFFAIFVAEDVLGMVPRGTHDYNRFVRPSTLTDMLEKNGVDVRDIKGMSYDPLKLEFRISNDPSVNYLGYGTKRE